MLFGRKILVTDADKQECEGRAPLRALFANCTLKSGDAPSHTEALFDAAVAPHLQEAGVGVSRLRIADLRLDPTTDPDHDQDDGPELVERVLGADILVIGTPLWLGRESSLAVRLMERLYAISGRTNDAGQSIFYNRVASVLVTGNEDGAKAASAQLLYGLQHLGFVIPRRPMPIGSARRGPVLLLVMMAPVRITTSPAQAPASCRPISSSSPSGCASHPLCQRAMCARLRECA